MNNPDTIRPANRADIFKRDNISRMFVSTAIAMIFTEITGVVAVLIDGIITSRFLGVDIYSAIALLRPFSSLILVVTGFFSTGCGILCSQQIGVGDKDGANEAFNLSVYLALFTSIIVIIFGLLFPTVLFRLCGIPLEKYPELTQHIYGYLHGYMIGIPALMLVQIIGPVLVMDNGKKLFTISTVALGIVDIVGDLLNVFVFHKGAFGMGVATSIGYYVQLIFICHYLIKKKSYFHISFKFFRLRMLSDLARSGSPALVKKLAGTLRDVFTNYFNAILALTAAAIAAKGIQSDLFQFLFCIPTGLGRTLIAMVSIYYSANDRHGLTRLYTYALRFGFKISAITGIIAFITAPLLTQIYTSDPEVISLAVFSIRWMSVALVFDTTIVLIQHYLQGTKNQKHANILSMCERFIVPTASALILGMLFGTRGILASMAVGKMVLLLFIFITNCVYCKGLPKHWYQVMFLPEGFGGDDSDNFYAEIHNREDVSKVSHETVDFCLQHETGQKAARMMSLFVEEMSVNVLDHAVAKEKKNVYVDFRLFVNENDICFSMMDRSDYFDPTAFYSLNKDNDEGHIGIKIVMEKAKDVRYFSAYDSNNLIVYLDCEDDQQAS